MIHVDLDELERLIFNHLDSLGIEQLAEVAELLSCQPFSVLGALKGLLEDGLNVSEPLDAVTHAQTEVSEPLVIESHCPVLG